MTEEALLRFKEKYKVSNGCWVWIAGKSQDGYGYLSINRKQTGAHRLSYSHFKGEIPKGMCVCHSCDNPSCVNPDHLWLGTIGDNNRDRDSKKRGANAKKTHCHKGHPFIGENLFIKNGARGCRECTKALKRKHYYRDKMRKMVKKLEEFDV